MEFSVPRTPQQNGFDERKNMTLIEAARTMLADSLLPVPFWAEAVNTACYVQNRVQLCGIKGIKREFSVPRTPQQNSIAERKNKTLIEVARTMLADSLLPIPFWAESAGSTNPQNNDEDAAFDGKEHDFDVKKPESEVNVSSSISAQSRKQDDKTMKEAKGKIPTAGQNSLNSTNTFSAAGPSNTTVSPTYGKSSFLYASQLPDDPDMPELEDITYSDDEIVVGAEVDFNNLESSIPSAFLYGTIEEEVYVCQPLGFEDLDHPDKVYKVVKVKQKKDGIFISQDKYIAEILKKFRLTKGKSGSTPIDTEKPLLKDLNGEDVDIHTYRLMIVPECT
nr:ribonuclease H-like domain-containing protein [Tanacetum cinerariifolium]